MRHPEPPSRTFRRRTMQRVQWVYVEPELTPPLTAEQIAALNAADKAKALARRNRPRRSRRPQHCRIGSSHYPYDNRSVPYLRLRGGWLAELGLVAGTQLRVECRDDGSILLSRMG